MASMEDVLAAAQATCEKALVNISFPIPSQSTALGKLKAASQSLANALRGHPYVEVHTLQPTLGNRRKDPLVIMTSTRASTGSGVNIERRLEAITFLDIANNPEILVRLLKEKSYP